MLKDRLGDLPTDTSIRALADAILRLERTNRGSKVLKAAKAVALGSIFVITVGAVGYLGDSLFCLSNAINVSNAIRLREDSGNQAGKWMPLPQNFKSSIYLRTGYPVERTNGPAKKGL